MRKIFSFAFGLIFAVFLVFAMESFALLYVVKPGETLSKIAQSLRLMPIYGSKGGIKQILALNPAIRHPDQIFAGQSLEVNVDSPIAPAPTEAKLVPVEPLAEGITAVLIPENHSWFELEPYFSSTSLSVTDSTTGSESTFNSATHFGIHASYWQRWSSRFDTFIGFHLGSISFEPPVSSIRTISDRTKILSGFGLGVQYSFNSDFKLDFSCRDQKELFARAVTTSDKTVDAVMVPRFELGVSRTIAQLNSLILRARMGAVMIFPAGTDSYRIRLGAQYYGKIYLQRRGHAQGGLEGLAVGLGASYRTQNTSLTSQQETSLTISLHLPLGQSLSNQKGGG